MYKFNNFPGILPPDTRTPCFSLGREEGGMFEGGETEAEKKM